MEESEVSQQLAIFSTLQENSRANTPRLETTVTTRREGQIRPLVAKVSGTGMQKNKRWTSVNIPSCLTIAVECTHSCLKTQFLRHGRQMLTR